MIRLIDVRKDFGGAAALPPTSLNVRSGEGLCLSGPSGCGKTTLLEIAAGIVRPDAGRVELAAGARACAFQDDVLVPWLSALDNVTLVLRGPRAARDAVARRWLARFGLAPEARPPAMSGGMRRRLNLARAFAQAPRLMYLDEPFAFLDPAWQRILVDLIRDTLNGGAAVLMTTHQNRALLKPLPEMRFLDLAQPSGQG